MLQRIFIVTIFLFLGFAGTAAGDFPSSSDYDPGNDQAIAPIRPATRHFFTNRPVSPTLAHHPDTMARTPDVPNHPALPDIPSRMGRELLQLLTLQRK